jgi:hypothetical protein
MSTGQPIEMGQTIRYPATALLCVNSDDQQKFNANGFRIDSSEPGRIYINGQRPLLFGYMTRLALTEMNIQWDTPNVNNSNSTMTMALYTATDSATPVVTLQSYIRIDLVTNFYTPEELATVVQTKLNNEPNVTANAFTFTVLYDEQDGSFSIAQTATYTVSGRSRGYFKIFSGSAPQSVTGFQALKDDLLYCMGLQAVSPAGAEPIGFYSSINGALAPMLYTPYIDVVSNLLTKNQNISDGTTSTIYTSSKLARIYFSNEAIINRHDYLPEDGTQFEASAVCNIPGTRPCIFRREFVTPKQIQWNNTENVDFIDIQVLDYKGNPVVIQEEFTSNTNPVTNQIFINQRNNTSFQMTIQATEN